MEDYPGNFAYEVGNKDYQADASDVYEEGSQDADSDCLQS